MGWNFKNKLGSNKKSENFKLIAYSLIIGFILLTLIFTGCTNQTIGYTYCYENKVYRVTKWTKHELINIGCEDYKKELKWAT